MASPKKKTVVKKAAKKAAKKDPRGSTRSAKAAEESGKARSVGPGKPSEDGGRPFKLNEDRLGRIRQAIATGATRDVAARFGGLDNSTYYRYMRDGRQLIEDLAAEDREPADERERLLVELVEQIEEAEVEAELRLLGNIATAGQEGDWRAAAHLLACRWPSRWSVKHRTEVSGPEGGPVEVNGTGILPILERHATDDK